MNRAMMLATTMCAMVMSCGTPAGSVQSDIALPSGVSLSTVGWDLTNGTDSDTYSGTSSLSGDGFTISTVNASQDYTLTLTGTNDAEDTTCTGVSVPFSIQAPLGDVPLTTQVRVSMSCSPILR